MNPLLARNTYPDLDSASLCVHSHLQLHMLDQSLEYGVPLLLQWCKSMSWHRYASIFVLLDAQVRNTDLSKLNLFNIDSLLAVLLCLHSLKLHQLLLLIFS